MQLTAHEAAEMRQRLFDTWEANRNQDEALAATGFPRQWLATLNQPNPYVDVLRTDPVRMSPEYRGRISYRVAQSRRRR